MLHDIFLGNVTDASVEEPEVREPGARSPEFSSRAEGRGGRTTDLVVFRPAHIVAVPMECSLCAEHIIVFSVFHQPNNLIK